MRSPVQDHGDDQGDISKVLKDKILAALDLDGFSVKNIFALSRNNPAVNQKLVRLLSEEHCL